MFTFTMLVSFALVFPFACEGLARFVKEVR
jgi:hypothetical protein